MMYKEPLDVHLLVLLLADSGVVHLVGESGEQGSHLGLERVSVSVHEQCETHTQGKEQEHLSA